MPVKRTRFINPTRRLDMSHPDGPPEAMHDEDPELDLHIGDKLHEVNLGVGPWAGREYFTVESVSIKYADGSEITYERADE
jgi:hypothetical protein